MRTVVARIMILSALVCAASMSAPGKSGADETSAPGYLKDRGTGMPTSMFGTYIHRCELLVYPFFEYYKDDDLEYKPSEFGYGLESDYRGKFRASEGILFLAYGVSDWIALEFEAAIIDARFDKAPDDASGTPARIEESGVGDIEGQIRVRMMPETSSRPEIFSYTEAVSPQQRKKVLIDTPDWELKAGVGAIKGFSWGTVTIRAAGQYLLEDSSFDYGEYAVEYLKRLSPRWRVYTGFEGSQDELSWITEAQWHMSEWAFLKINNGLGMTSKATDWAPEVGIMFSLPRGR